MGWISILLAVALALVLLPYLAGMALPDEYVGTLHVLLPASIDRVWSELQDWSHHPVSGAMARVVRPSEEPNGGWEEDLGNTVVLVTTAVEEPPRRWVREIRDATMPMTSRWTMELETNEEGTLVRAENRTIVRSGSWRSPVFRLILRSTGAADKVLREYFRSIAGSLHVTARAVQGGASTARDFAPSHSPGPTGSDESTDRS